MKIRTKESPKALTISESISRRRLINILNYVNYKGAEVSVNLKNHEDGSTLSLRARPELCTGETVSLIWSEGPPRNTGTIGYNVADFLIDKGSRVITVSGRVVDVSRLGITFALPEHCLATSRRQNERFASITVHSTLSCGEWKATGKLQDFGGGYLKVRLTARDVHLAKVKNRSPIQITLMTKKTTVYNGIGVMKRWITNGHNIDVVIALTALGNEKRLDEQAVTLSRNLVATCRHPLSDRMVRLSITKASYNSFEVSERLGHAALFPGLIIPETKIDFGAGDFAGCMMQVTGGDGGTWIMSILDMPILDQRKLFSFIERETGMSSGVSKVIDPDELIEFFFEVGFIYPKKYDSLRNSKEHLKQILSRLYVDTPSIAQQFVRYNEDAIEAHIAMVRFHERSWVVHHHSAIGGSGAGSAVLMQIFRYIHSYSTLPSTSMDYVMTYYRPENRFPDRVLGGIARFLRQPSLCSIDPFAYLHLHFHESATERQSEGKWELLPTSHEDLLKLNTFYKNMSGGLTVKAFGLHDRNHERETVDLDMEFKKAGLRRRKSVFSLKSQGKLNAVIMALDSDDGLNMSNLLKCVHVFVIDKDGFSFDQLMNQLNRLSSLYQEQEIPVLLFPASYASDEGVNIEKVYNLLVFHVSVGKQFAEFVERMTKRAIRRKYGVVG
jgi:hypothetical protein